MTEALSLVFGLVGGFVIRWILDVRGDKRSRVNAANSEAVGVVEEAISFLERAVARAGSDAGLYGGKARERGGYTDAERESLVASTPRLTSAIALLGRGGKGVESDYKGLIKALGRIIDAAYYPLNGQPKVHDLTLEFFDLAKALRSRLHELRTR